MSQKVTYENVGKDVPKYSWDSSSVGKGTKCLVVRKTNSITY